MKFRFQRFLCKVFGHRLEGRVNHWQCLRCDYSIKRNGVNGNVVPTDRITPKAPARKSPPPRKFDALHAAFLLRAFDEAESRDMLMRDVLRERNNNADCKKSIT